MIDNKNNWYLRAQNESEIIQEAGMANNLRNLILSVSLFFSGLSLKVISERTGLSEDQITQALNNPSIVEIANRSNESNVNESNVNESPANESNEKPSVTRLDFSGVEELIREHEVSGAKRYVTVNNKQIDIRKAYPDPLHGWRVPTIGVGYNLNKPEARKEIGELGLDYNKVYKGEQSLTDEQVDKLYRNDISKAIYSARKFLSNFDQQPTEVKTVIIDMAFNLGETRLNKFKKFKKALENNNYEEAAKQMEDSRWYNQVGNRAINNVNKIEQNF